MTTSSPKKVLFLCTGNSARSIIAEYLLRAKGRGRFETFSAGAHPTGRVNPFAIWVLKNKYLIDASAARSKSWDEFRAVKFDFVITVCDQARESCPIRPGQPVIAHWGSPDPAAVEGAEEEKQRIFVNVASQINRRIELFCALSEEKLTALQLGEIGGQFQFTGPAQLTH
jgi:arsenate reductase (thioredoxin)